MGYLMQSRWHKGSTRTAMGDWRGCVDIDLWHHIPGHANDYKHYFLKNGKVLVKGTHAV
jgi:hypothetical protein